MNSTENTRALARARRDQLDSVQALVTAATVGAAAWLTYGQVPATWTTFHRQLTTGLVAVVAGLLVNVIASTLLARRHVRLNELAYGPYDPPAHTLGDDGASSDAQPLPETLLDALVQAENAAAVDAAKRAASEAFQLDRSSGFLRNADRWRGYADGEASFFLAPGLNLHFASVVDTFGSEARFTLLTADADAPVAITDVAQLRHILDARLMGRPLAPERPTGPREDRPVPVAV
ncbi:hypothetical protein ACEZCY_35905 [Streptacidiphilus sp. N1-12]|uniref:Uncharacterized protein n=1 Tax=Streptacidiphilus alkalitolerans TaxID=3342712 RepID=A0ABV6WRH0_9ACTN